MTLRWRPPPRVWGKAGRSCVTKPAERGPTPQQELAALRDDVRVYLAEHRAARHDAAAVVLELAELHAQREVELLAGYQDALAALASSEALAREELHARALDKIADELVRFEAACRHGRQDAAVRRLREVCRRLGARG